MDELRGHEAALWAALGVNWSHSRKVSGKIHCPFPDHPDKNPSWRLSTDQQHWFCSCEEKGGSIVDAVIRMGKADDFKGAMAWCREVIGQPTRARPARRNITTEKNQGNSTPQNGEKCSTIPKAGRKPKPSQLAYKQWRAPSEIYIYHWANGEIAEVRARYEDGTGRKEVIPWTWDGAGWVSRQLKGARPLYRLPGILDEPDKPVLVVEGEGAKLRRAVELFGDDFCVTSCSGGAQAAAGMDFTPLRGRSVVVWPDNDAAGRKYAETVCRLSLAAGAAEARIVDVPEEWPHAWDLGDEPPSDSVDLREMLDEARAIKRDLITGESRFGRDTTEQGRTNGAGSNGYIAEIAETAPNGSVSSFGTQPHDDLKSHLAQNGVSNGHDATAIILRPSMESDWQTDEKGRPLKNEYNMLLAFSKLGVRLSHDDFAYEYRIEGLPGYGPVLSDDALDELYLTVARGYDLKPTKADFDRIALSEGRRHRFHPVRDYLASIEWDGVERLDEWLTTYLGAKDDAEGVTRAIGRIMLIAAVRRVRKPGCKFDTMVVLEGPQGVGKSRALAALCALPEWFSDGVALTMTPKEIMELSAGKWIMEAGELAGMRRAETEHVKAMLSRQRDEARMAYGKLSTKRPRQCVFIGTTNEDAYLIDETGNRRFLPVKTGWIDVESIARDRDQLWAEAAHFEAKGEAIHLSKDASTALQKIQQEREIHDEWEGQTAAWLDETYPAPWASERDQKTTILDIAVSALGLEKGRLGSVEQKRIARCLKKCGWAMSQRSNGKRFWRRAEPANSAF